MRLTKQYVKPLQVKIEYFKAQLAMIKSHANDNEQYSRRCNLRFHGIPGQKGENCLLVHSKFCKEELNCDIPPQDIDRAQRVGQIRSDGSSRAIIVNFVSYQSTILDKTLETIPANITK
jgi:hypothetical protein